MSNYDLVPIADVLMAMSGGVDSTVAAFLLLKEGYKTAGATMKLFDDQLIGEDIESGCCSLDDVMDARNACTKLGIEHFVFNMKKHFKHDVVDRFCDAYISGLTPNPCIDCNRYLKFEALQQRRRELGATYVATGHYARRHFDEATGKWQLLRATDKTKDQSYVLYHLTQDDLSHMLFPIGHLTKNQVREIAHEQRFNNADKSESQDICFIPNGNYKDFIERYKELNGRDSLFRQGDIVDVEGKKLGCHNGLINYTIGQRRGIGIASKEPLYVLEKNLANNQLVVAPQSALFESEAYLNDVNIISGNYTERAFVGEVKAGYRQAPVAARIEIAKDRTAHVHYDAPHIRTAPGQSIVFYVGDCVVGGGVCCNKN
ncbi:tRNA 2-thiouridine(34) synthase MnmA [Adlercreutzia sp. ZJ304]|uniref:tRNA 2-thiouridine(34) synthase MnmA n=1 Tax=Adlercreutzia sp. ZJ304 TaxID=2709791 RepID=UPI00197DE098|nr:tRNA 2-thiouridine(34) synthase MnmA [Adlercreutzia sp. ZJ304]